MDGLDLDVIGRMKMVVHARGQPQRRIGAVAIERGVAGIPEQLLQPIARALDLKKPVAVDPAAGADDRVARAGQDFGIRIERPRAVAQLANEAIVQAAEFRLASVGQVDVAEQPPDDDREVAHQRLLDAAEPAHEPRREAPWQPVGEQEVEPLMRARPRDAPRTVIIPSRAGCMDGRMIAKIALAAGAGCRYPAVKGGIDLSRAKHRRSMVTSNGARIASRIRSTTLTIAPSSAPTIRRRSGGAARGRFRPARRSLRRQIYRSHALAETAREGLSDLQFIDAYRVPFQFARKVRASLGTTLFYEASDGVMLTDVDGNRAFDLAGSYGVNLLGYDFYKACIDEGTQAVRSLGPVLGIYHPLILGNVERLKRISGMEEVSFHMGDRGGDAGGAAGPLSYGTAPDRARRGASIMAGGRRSAGHRQSDPGPRHADPRRPVERARASRSPPRHRLRPRQPAAGAHPNAAAPGSAGRSSRRAGFERAAYTDWLKRLRDVCTRRGIVLIFDEVFVGFRLARARAGLFRHAADLVTYGKTVAGASGRRARVPTG